jgi:hypothetical protein
MQTSCESAYLLCTFRFTQYVQNNAENEHTHATGGD